MRIQIWKYVIKDDSGHGYVVGEPYTYIAKRADGSTEAAEGVKNARYPGTFRGALKGLLERSLRDSDVRTIREALRHIDEFDARLDQRLGQEAPNG